MMVFDLLTCIFAICVVIALVAVGGYNASSSNGEIAAAAALGLLARLTIVAERVRYLILRIPYLTGSVMVHAINRLGAPFLGTGEAGHGPTAGAIASAFAERPGCGCGNCRSRPHASRRLPT